MANEHNLRPAQPGEVRNPNGRPKGSRNRATIVRELLGFSHETENPVTGQTELLTVEQEIALAVIVKARKGDVSAYLALMDSAYGKPTQSLEVNQSLKPECRPPSPEEMELLDKLAALEDAYEAGNS